MQSLDSFTPQGNTTRISATAASATAAIQPSTGYIQGLRCVNLSTNDAYLAFGVSTATAVAPTTAAGGNAGIPLLQRTERMFVTPPNVWVSAITTAGQADVAVTPGTGQ